MTREQIIRSLQFITEYTRSEAEANAVRNAILCHDQAQREEISRLLQAVGLASTLKPDMEINVNDPIGMMQQVHKHVTEEIRQLREALTVLMEEKIDYMRLNNLGNAELTHSVTLARQALAKEATHDNTR